MFGARLSSSQVAAKWVSVIWNMGGSVKDKLFSDRERHQAGFFTDNKQMKRIALRGCFFYKILMTKGERIGIHD